MHNAFPPFYLPLKSQASHTYIIGIDVFTHFLNLYHIHGISPIAHGLVTVSGFSGSALLRTHKAILKCGFARIPLANFGHKNSTLAELLGAVVLLHIF